MQRKPRDKRLYWRGGKLWARVPNAAGRIVRVTTRCTDETAASARADELERRFADPRHAAASAATLKGCVSGLLADMKRRGLALATRKIAVQKLGHFLRVWGEELPMIEVGPQLVLDYIDKRTGEEVTRFTIAKELAHLGQLLKLARYLGVYHRDPAEVLPPFFRGDHKPRKRKLMAGEFEKLLAEFERGRAAHLCFIVATGARRSEVAKAQPEDVHEDYVHVRGTKTEAADDDVPITPLARPWIGRAVGWAPGRVPGHPMFAPWGNLTRDLASACTRAGIPRVTPNDLRRTFGSWHRDAGVSAELVSKLLRHTTDKLAQTTYAKLQAPAVGALVAGQIRVPELYPEAHSTVPETPPKDDDPPGFSRATHGIRTHDLRFTKPYAERVSRGTKLGLARKRAECVVPDPYLVAFLTGMHTGAPLPGHTVSP